jgi:hypothetical protein
MGRSTRFYGRAARLFYVTVERGADGDDPPRDFNDFEVAARESGDAFRDGRIAQVATPEALWARPVDEWVARFLGMANVFSDGEHATVVRPEAVGVLPGEGAVVVAADRDGPVVRLRVREDGGRELEAVVVAVDVPRVGERVAVDVDPRGVVDVALWRPEMPGRG